MLTIFTGGGARTCDGLGRRDFLQAGALGLGGLTLPWLLRARAEAAPEPKFVRDKAVVLIFLSGGASHIETFNPNMAGPAPSRSVTGEVKTAIPGLTLGGTFPLLARHAKKLAAVRAFRHPIGNHVQAICHVLSGGTDATGQGNVGHSLGSMYARLRGANHPASGLPTYALLTAPHRDPQYRNEAGRMVLGSRPGPLGATFAPFVPSDPRSMANLCLRLPAARLEDRRALLRRLDGLKRGLDDRDAAAGLGPFEQQAVDLLLGNASQAFDVSREPKAVLERYDTSAFLCGKKLFDPSTLGKQMLLARRLIEAGAGFVTVHSAGWDMHADANNPGIGAGMEMLGRPLDKALAAFLDDVEQRGLLDKVLVIVTGDFGRTPKINNRGGRDHWANLSTLGLFGGGLKTGQVIGRSDRNNAQPATPPYSTPNLLSTVMHYLFDVGTLRLARGAPSNLVKLIENNRPIAELF